MNIYIRDRELFGKNYRKDKPIHSLFRLRTKPSLKQELIGLLILLSFIRQYLRHLQMDLPALIWWLGFAIQEAVILSRGLLEVVHLVLQQ